MGFILDHLRINNNNCGIVLNSHRVIMSNIAIINNIITANKKHGIIKAGIVTGLIYEINKSQEEIYIK